MDVCRNGRGRLERCELWGNEDASVVVQSGDDPTLAACTVRDHVHRRAGRRVGGYPWSGCGVYVWDDAEGKATVGADCVFERNARGDVVRR